MLIVLGSICIISLYVALQMEPSEPKSDRRYKTGYKNNATMPTKSQGIKNAQKFLVLLGIVSGITWYFVGGGDFIKGFLPAVKSESALSKEVLNEGNETPGNGNCGDKVLITITLQDGTVKEWCE